MRNGILLDTDILVDVSRGHERAVDFLQGFVGERVFVTVFTYAELLMGASNEHETERIGQFLSAFNMLYPDVSISENAIRIIKEWRLRSGIGIIDAFIAATAVEHGLPLYSRNRKHFEVVKGLKFHTPY